MRSIESCWNYLRLATGNQVIVSLGAGAYDILPLEPNGLGESYLETSPARIVGVYSPGVDLASIQDDADALEQRNHAQ